MSALLARLLLFLLTFCGFHPSHVGDYGSDLPTRFDRWTCQDLSDGELIYSPFTDQWMCESRGDA